MKAEYPKHLAVRVSVDLNDRLKKVASDEGVSVSDFIRSLIENRLGA